MENQQESGPSYGRPLAGLSTAILTEKRRCQSPWLSLVLDAYIKAERARREWRIADALGDHRAAKCARLRMFRHRAIAYHLEQAMDHEPA